MFDREEAMVMRQKYESGMTSTQIAEEHYMCFYTVCDWLKRVGTKMRPSGTKRVDIPEHVKRMIITDWNAGLKGRDIAKKYGLEYKQLTGKMWKWRKQGEPLAIRCRRTKR